MELDFLNGIETLTDISENINSNMEKHKIKFVVNSHVDYMEDSLKLMLPYILREIPTDEIMVVIGGNDKEETIIKYDIPFHFVDYNAYDFHSFIYIVENREVVEGFDYIFYLHDTCLPLHDFRRLAYNFQSGVKTYSAWNKSNSNLGLYSVNHLFENMNNIIGKYKYIPTGKIGQSLEDSLTVAKHTNAYNFHYTLAEKGIGDALVQVGEPEKQGAEGFPFGYKDVYHTGVARRCMLYRNLNLAKFKTFSDGTNGYGGTRK
tara:strand:+ start:177 stop:959 length:783 start_codon:yes stop_codon:yes gene_type:complete